VDEERAKQPNPKREPGAEARRERIPKPARRAKHSKSADPAPRGFVSRLTLDPAPPLPNGEGAPVVGAEALTPPSVDTPLQRAARETRGEEGLRGRWVELAFGQPRSRWDAIVVFHHVRKTAGTSMKEMILHNVPGGSRVLLAYPEGSGEELRAWWQQLFSVMTPEETECLWAVSSHTAGYALDLVPGAALGLTMVRDPIDQALSRWFMGKRTRGPADDDTGRLEDVYKRDAKQEDWYNPQARTLLEPHFDTRQLAFTLGPPPDANVWRARLFSLLSRRFLVGVQDAFEDSVQRFADELGWSDTKAATQKVNPYRPHGYQLDPELADTMRAACWLDLELYEEYAKAFGERELAGAEEPAAGKRRAPGYTVEAVQSGDTEADLRVELERTRRQLAQESQALRLRLRALELELHELRALGPERGPLLVEHKRERAEAVPSAQERVAADRRRKDEQRRAQIRQMRAG
jgi:hypothetical protein